MFTTSMVNLEGHYGKDMISSICFYWNNSKIIGV